MARQEEEREDLLREATALIERIELRVDGCEGLVFAGFRRDGSASFFFGQQVVHQFNRRGEWRRGFENGRLLKAENGGIVQLIRERTAEAINLLRQELTPRECFELLADAKSRLQRLLDALTTRQFEIVGQAPPNSDVGEHIRQWLSQLPASIPIANSPRLA